MNKQISTPLINRRIQPNMRKPDEWYNRDIRFYWRRWASNHACSSSMVLDATWTNHRAFNCRFFTLVLPIWVTYHCHRRIHPSGSNGENFSSAQGAESAAGKMKTGCNIRTFSTFSECIWNYFCSHYQFLLIYLGFRSHCPLFRCCWHDTFVSSTSRRIRTLRFLWLLGTSLVSWSSRTLEIPCDSPFTRTHGLGQWISCSSHGFRFDWSRFLLPDFCRI